MDWHGASMASEVIFRDPVEVFTWKWCVKHCVCCLEVTLLYFTFQEQRPMYNPRRGHSKRMTHWSRVTCHGHSVKIILKSSQITCYLSTEIFAEICTGLVFVADWGTGPNHCTALYWLYTVYTVYTWTLDHILGVSVSTPIAIQTKYLACNYPLAVT